MKSTRSKPPTSARKTPYSRPRHNNMTFKDPVQVYCRLRPMPYSTDVSCMKVVSNTTIIVTPPESAVNFRSTNVQKEIQTTFSSVFTAEVTQREIFDAVALPLVENLIQGRNGLLFTYGVTGSGKTYTMMGETNDSGILPRCLDVIFNSISNYQAKKFVFSPDRLNGFDVQSDTDALLDRQNELQMAPRNGKTPRSRKAESGSDSNPTIPREVDESRVLTVDQDNIYAVFITFVEIYNNSVYDLLEDDDTRPKTLQSKIVREDGNKNMYVHAVTEIEVKSSEEAFEVFQRGQRRRRVAHTALNAESSRSHNIFTIRLVQAPLDSEGEQVIQDKRVVCISQLSLVDLAGSERTNRTKTSGQRLREAGNINNSLMTLRSCLEILRENQTQGVSKMVPYRDSKLTHLFKNYFDGEGQVRMVVCINPRCEDFDENTQVMKFAEMTQEVQIARPTPMKADNGFTPGRRKANQIFKMAVHNLEEMGRIDAKKLDVDIGLVYSLGPKFPDYRLLSPETDELIVQLMQHLDQRIKKRATLLEDYNARQNKFRMQLVRTEQDMASLRNENARLTEMLKLERSRGEVYAKKIETMECAVDEVNRKLHDRETQIKQLQDQNNKKQRTINELEMRQDRMKYKYESKLVTETEKKNRQLAKEFKEKEDMLNDRVRSNSNKIRQIMKIANAPSMENVDVPTTSSRERSVITNTISSTPRHTKYSAQDIVSPRPRGIAAANNRYRRSKSTDERWLEHHTPNPVPLGTIFQPYYKSRKSITKLTDAKDIVNAKTSKYCLVSQGADTDGEVETRLYKGNVIPTCGGGAQVVFNDVECLKQKSPIASPRRLKRPSDEEPNINNIDELTSRCSIGIQGSKKSKF